MKAALFLVTVLVAGLVVGCSDQIATVAPVTSHQQMGKSIQVLRFDVDLMLVEPISGEQYHVVGYIDYVFDNFGGTFKFQRSAQLSVDSPSKGLTTSISTDQASNGEVKEGEPTIVVDEFQLGEITPGHFLCISFELTDVVALSDMFMEAREIIATDK